VFRPGDKDSHGAIGYEMTGDDWAELDFIKR
jgi:hypothetical protein